MLKVLSIGEGVQYGTEELIFSSHCKAINFIRNKQVISVCSNALCPGYYRIILDSPNLDSVRTMHFTEGQLEINGQPCSMAEAQRYEVPCFRTELGIREISRRLKQCFDIFRDSSPAHSVYALIHFGQDSGFAGALSADFRAGRDYLRQANYKMAVKCFKAKGFGFTPGGDDFLAGYILGLSFIQKVEQKDLSGVLDLLFYASLSENYLVNTFMIQSRHLKPDQDWADFLMSLVIEMQNPREALCKILKHGASSGYDTLSGFFAAWEII